MTPYRFFIFALAGLFYLLLLFYVASELYYNHTYWRLILRRKRRHRWEFLLWFQQTLLILVGIAVIAASVMSF